MARQSEGVSKWVRKVVGAYVILVIVGAVLGFMGGGLAGIYVMPLLLPWIIVAPMIEQATGWNLLDHFWAGPLTVLISGMINAYLLFVILRFVDGRRRGRRATTNAAP